MTEFVTLKSREEAENEKVKSELLTEEQARKTPLDQLYVFYAGKTYRASELQIYINGTSFRKLKSFNDMLSAFNEYKKDGASSLYTKTGQQISYSEEYKSLQYLPFALPDNIEQDVNKPAGEGEPTITKKVQVLEKTSDYSSAYLFVKLSSGSWLHINKADIGCFEGSRFFSLDKKDEITSFDDLMGYLKDNNLTLYTSAKYGNMAIDKVCKDDTYALGEEIEREELDLKTMQKRRLVPNPDITDTKNPWIEKKDSTKPIDCEVSEQRFVKTTDEKGKPVSKLEVRNYTYSEGGIYINVKHSSTQRSMLVAIGSLYELDGFGNIDESKPIDKTKLREYLNKRVGVIRKDAAGNIIERFVTEPLTIEQISVTMDSVKYMHDSDASFDPTAKDTTYLRLKNGKYVEERTAIRPVCYEYVSNDEYLAAKDRSQFMYMAQTKEGITLIVDEETYQSGKVKYENATYEIDQKNSFVIKKADPSKSIKECNVIQTTKTNGNVQGCTVVKPPHADINEDSVKAACEKFLEQYKAGLYTLDEVVVGGEYQELDNQAKLGHRYTITDVATRTYYPGQNENYKYLETNPLTFDGKKIEGGPKYNTKKAVKEFMKGWLKAAGFATIFTFSVGGLLAGLVSPFILAGLAGATVLTGIFGPAITAIIYARKNAKLQKGLKLERSTKLQKDAIEREINDELQLVLTKTKELAIGKEVAYLKSTIQDYEKELARPDLDEKTRAEKKKKLEKYRLDLATAEKTNVQSTTNCIDRIDSVAQKLLELSTVDYKATFTMANGRGQVNDSNVALCQDYKNLVNGELDKKNKAVETLKNKLKHAKGEDKASLERELKIAEADLDHLCTYYATNANDPAGELYRSKVEMVKTFKAFTLLKYYGTDEDKKALEGFDFDIKKGELVYVGKLTAKKRKDKKEEITKSITKAKEYIKSHNTIEVNGVKYVVGELKFMTSTDEIINSKVSETKVNMPVVEDMLKAAKEAEKTAEREETLEPTPGPTPEPAPEPVVEEEKKEMTALKLNNVVIKIITSKEDGRGNKVAFSCTASKKNDDKIHIVVTINGKRQKLEGKSSFKPTTREDSINFIKESIQSVAKDTFKEEELISYVESFVDQHLEDWGLAKVDTEETTAEVD